MTAPTIPIRPRLVISPRLIRALLWLPFGRRIAVWYVGRQLRRAGYGTRVLQIRKGQDDGKV